VECVWSHRRRRPMGTTSVNNLLKCAYTMTYKLLPDSLDRILSMHTSFKSYLRSGRVFITILRAAAASVIMSLYEFARVKTPCGSDTRIHYIHNCMIYLYQTVFFLLLLLPRTVLYCIPYKIFRGVQLTLLCCSNSRIRRARIMIVKYY